MWAAPHPGNEIGHAYHAALGLYFFRSKYNGFANCATNSSTPSKNMFKHNDKRGCQLECDDNDADDDDNIDGDDDW